MPMAEFDRKNTKIVLSGASGMLGAAVSKALLGRNASLLRLVRRAPATSNELLWNPVASSPPALERLEGLRGAIHLSGANVASRRWSAAYKRELTESRVATTLLLSETLAKLNSPPEVLIAASAMGFYGNRGEEILDEDSPMGTGFFPELCSAWEAATRPAEDAGIRVVHLRITMILGADRGAGGGALAKLAPLFRLGLGGQLGSGKQWMSWISEVDAVGAALFALDNAALSGAVNLGSPNPVTNTEFTHALGHAVHRPAILPAPAFALRLVFGEMADEALLASTRVQPRRLLDAGFRFAHPTLPEALAAALPA